MAILALAPSAHAAATSPTAPMPAPVPGKLQTYRDWTIGCDNGNGCETVSLIPEQGDPSDTALMIGLRRDAGPAARPFLWTSTNDESLSGTLDFIVDGRKAMSAPMTRGELRIEGPQASALAAAIARGTVLEVKQGARLIGKPSLAGAAAAFRYLDAQQGRAGTITALVATGPLPAQAVKAAPALPVLRRPALAAAKAVSLWRQELASAGRISGCTDEMEDRDVEIHPLGHERALVLVPCGAGAYNFSSVPLIATGAPGRRTFAFARFDYQPGWSENASEPMLVNAGWNEATAELSSYAKGRGLGDCGSAETYMWDGAMFRLTEATAMGECRGAWHWLTLWQAKVVPAK